MGKRRMVRDLGQAGNKKNVRRCHDEIHGHKYEH